MNKYRLPEFIKPSHYAISLSPDLKNFTFTGEEKITITVEKPTNVIKVNSAELAIKRATISSGSQQELVGEVSYDQETETAICTFSQELPAGEYILSFTFSGTIHDRLRGIYKSRYEIDGKEDYIAVTQFESTDARRAFPCFDEPASKAVFELRLTISQELTAVANTPAVEVTENAGTKTVQFASTPKMSTYLVAFAVGKLEFVETKTKEGVGVKVYTTTGKTHQAKFALEVAAKMLSFYNEYFDIAYPLPEMNLIAVPDFAAGAMENWGAVTFRETALLIDEKHSSTANKQWVALVIAHEFAHMWFGDLVTMEWWTDLWLNEGFATFVEFVATDKLFPEWDLWTQFATVEHNSALKLDGLKHTHPIEVPVNNPAEISEIFDEVSYAKGASVIQMLAAYLGEKDFREGLRFYLKKYSYSNAQTSDLWAAFEHVSGKPIQALMQNWTKKPGYPVITVTDTGDTLSFSQQRFFNNPVSAKEDTEELLWSVPISVTTQQNSFPQFTLMEGKEVQIPKPMGAPLKVNASETSFFRVLYPETDLKQLGVAIENGELSAVDRIGVVRDAFDLAEGGLTSVVGGLELAKAYKEETDYSVWAELSGHIHHLGNLLVASPSVSATYKTYAQSLYAVIAQRVGWEKLPGERHTDPLLRSLALFGYGWFGDTQTVEVAKDHFTKYLDSKPLDPDLRGVVYTLAAVYGGETEYNQLLSLYRKEELHQEKDRLARSLAAFTQPELIQKTLEWSLTSDVRSQDSPRVLYAVYANPYGRDLAWEFTKNHFEYYKKTFAGGHMFTRVIEGAHVFATEEKAKDIEEFFAKNPTPEVERTSKQVVEQIQANASWLQRDLPAITSFLAK